MVITEARAEVWREPKVRAEVGELGKQEAAVQGEHEKLLELGSEEHGDLVLEVCLFGSQGFSSRSELDCKQVRRGGEELEDGWVAFDHGEDGALGREGEVGAAFGKDAEWHEVTGLGEEEGLELLYKSELAVLHHLLVQLWVAYYLLGGGR